MKTVFFDVDTQLDFLLPAGALYVPGAEAVIPNLAKLNRFAVASGATLISTQDAHTENDVEFAAWPPHCVVGTVGQLKPAETLVGSGQTFFSKVTTNAFADGSLDRLLDSLEPVERYVVYGVATDVCVDFVVKGLLRRGAGSKTVVVTDAMRALSPAGEAALLADLAAAGGGTATTAEIVSASGAPPGAC